MGYNKGMSFGIYRIERVLSDAGGTSSVIEASITSDPRSHERVGRRVAVKIVRTDHDKTDLYEELLRREIKLLNDLRHPGIVRVYPIAEFKDDQYLGRARELNDKNPPWYFTMELLRSSVAKIAEDRRFSLSWRVELIFQIAQVLDYLHLRSVGHNDLKPENILFRYEPDPTQLPMPVLIDFGLSEKRMVQSMVNAATFTHASPERIRYLMGSKEYRKTDEMFDYLCSDIWAFGVICYEILNRGRYLYPKFDQRTQLIDNILNRDPSPFDPSVPRKLRDLVMAMLSKEPKNRPNTHEIICRLETDIEHISPRLQP
jgi:serine/threonine protein kinase